MMWNVFTEEMRSADKDNRNKINAVRVFRALASDRDKITLRLSKIDWATEFVYCLDDEASFEACTKNRVGR